MRAAVLGANDGIISTAGLVVGVAAADVARADIATAGVAGLVAGSISMALGEYVSVSTQRATEEELVAKERLELETMPEAELRELVGILRDRGLSPETAEVVAEELSADDPLPAHLHLELRLDPDDLANPWAAAGSSAAAFAVGALLPLVAILGAPASSRIAITFVAVLVALVGTGFLSARLGGFAPGKAIVRLVGGGALALAITFGIGQLVGTAVG